MKIGVSFEIKRQMNLKLLDFSFRTTAPVMFGYVPLGIAFGLMFSKLGYHWIYSFLMSAFVYAGSAQFLALGMIAARESLAEIGLMTLILNLRQGFYGMTLLHEFRTNLWKKIYLIFGLSDEPYSIISGVSIPQDFDKHEAYLYCNLWMHFYWVSGCTAGAFVGSNSSLNVEGMDFALNALFIILTIDQIKKINRVTPFVVAVVIGAISLFYVGRAHMLVCSIIGSIVYILLRGKKLKWVL